MTPPKPASPANNSAACPYPWLVDSAPRLRSQIQFLIAIDGLKSVHRASRIVSGERHENSAEHSWHLTLFARLLAEHANTVVDVDRVVFMLMIHDIVEVDAGDLPLHSPQDPDRAALEQAAAERLFGLLPDDQAQLLHQSWQEFEAGETADAKFAKAVDRLQPVLLNALTEGGTWPDFDVSLAQVQKRCAGIAAGSDELWALANAIFNEAADRGWLRTDPPTG